VVSVVKNGGSNLKSFIAASPFRKVVGIVMERFSHSKGFTLVYPASESGFGPALFSFVRVCVVSVAAPWKYRVLAFGLNVQIGYLAIRNVISKCYRLLKSKTGSAQFGGGFLGRSNIALKRDRACARPLSLIVRKGEMVRYIRMLLVFLLVFAWGVAFSAEPTVYYILNDHLDTPRSIVDSNNQEVWRWEGEPFGNTLPDEDPGKTGTKFTFNLRFPGQLYDQETGRNYNMARDYNPETGRYTQSDPIGLVGGINAYAYASNSPTLYVDPLGLAYCQKTPPVVPCPGIGGQSCGAPVRPPGINPLFPNVCYQCLMRNGQWPAPGAPVPPGL